MIGSGDGDTALAELSTAVGILMQPYYLEKQLCEGNSEI